MLKPRFSEKIVWDKEMIEQAVKVFGWIRQSRSVPPEVYEAKVEATENVSLEVVIIRPGKGG